MAIEDMVRTMLNELREIVKTETVVGEPVMCWAKSPSSPYPKYPLDLAQGVGQGKKDDGSSGTGGGGSVQPVAFIVIQKGKAQLLPIEDKSMSIADLLKYAPDVLEKIKAFKDKRKTDRKMTRKATAKKKKNKIICSQT